MQVINNNDLNNEGNLKSEDSLKNECDLKRLRKGHLKNKQDPA